ncbi:MAG: MogA/MoaB family molybdenum cofactor biosynthesis protein [Chloroflexota bacterium]
MKIAILIISDRGSRGEYEDRSGPVFREIIEGQTAWKIGTKAIVPDEQETIANQLKQWCDQEEYNLIMTSGGTGFSPRDVTPEATRSVLEREAPGIAEALRAESLKITRHAMLSRAIAGIRGQTLIVNMPGNPKAVRENLDVLLPILPHALELLVDAPDTESQHRSV